MNMVENNTLDVIVEHLRIHGNRTFRFVGRSGVETLPFGALHDEVSSGAAAARQLGIQRGQVVAVIVENGRDAVWIDLVLMAVGVTAIHLPEASASAHLSRPACRIDFVLVTGAHRPAVEWFAEAPVGELGNFSVHRTAPSTAPGAQLSGVPAIVLSSGTSGRVKHLLVSAPGLLHHASVFYQFCGAGSSDSFLLFLPFSNYQQKLLTYGAILNGVNLAITDAQRVFDGLRTTAPTLFLAPPVFYESALRLAAATNGEGAGAVAKLRALFGGNMRVMWCGMAPVSRHVLEEFNAAGLPLCEAYGMTEFGPIAANLPRANRVGAVGRPLASGSVDLSDEQEVIATATFPLTVGYLGESQAEQERVYLAPGRIGTGDIGHVDEDGYLWIQCRKKELIITSGGHKVSPPEIEQQFMDLEFVRHAIVMGDGRAFLGILLMVHRLEGTEEAAVVRKIEALNAGVCRAHPIRKWSLCLGEFSVEDGLLTRNLKINRQRVIERFEAAVFG